MALPSGQRTPYKCNYSLFTITHSESGIKDEIQNKERSGTQSPHKWEHGTEPDLQLALWPRMIIWQPSPPCSSHHARSTTCLLVFILPCWDGASCAHLWPIWVCGLDSSCRTFRGRAWRGPWFWQEDFKKKHQGTIEDAGKREGKGKQEDTTTKTTVSSSPSPSHHNTTTTTIIITSTTTTTNINNKYNNNERQQQRAAAMSMSMSMCVEGSCLSMIPRRITTSSRYSCLSISASSSSKPISWSLWISSLVAGSLIARSALRHVICDMWHRNVSCHD